MQSKEQLDLPKHFGAQGWAYACPTSAVGCSEESLACWPCNAEQTPCSQQSFPPSLRSCGPNTRVFSLKKDLCIVMPRAVLKSTGIAFGSVVERISMETRLFTHFVDAKDRRRFSRSNQRALPYQQIEACCMAMESSGEPCPCRAGAVPSLQGPN